MTPRHFLDIADHDITTLRDMLDRAARLKRHPERPLVGKTLATIFEKPSTRTRVSFEVGMRQLGGEVISLTGTEIQLGHGETIADTGRVLSRFVDAIMIRTNDPAKLDELASATTVPVINGLTDRSHPCQIMADILTFQEKRGPIAGRTVCWVGDANNVCESWIHAAARFGFALRIAAPRPLQPSALTLAWAAANGGQVTVTQDARAAVTGVDLVVTDTWVSMHHRDAEERYRLLTPYRVDANLMAGAAPDALFMHCLPAHRGDEVTSDVLDGPQSAVWDEAENRLHAQKGILTWCFDQ